MNAKNLRCKWLLPTFLLGLIITFSFSAIGSSRDFSVQGTVSGDNGPLPGVTIVEKGTTNGTTSDGFGHFKLNVSSSDAVLVFSFVGYQTKEVLVAGRSTIQVRLQTNAQQLSKLVVTALGIKRSERALGYSVGTVSGEDIAKSNVANFTSALAGKVPGVDVSTTGGFGSSVSVVIRGATSLTGNNQPLYVVDGVPINSGLNNVSQVGDGNVVDYGNVISDIDPNSIASISILKGPSAAALYGSRAANGVVLITTKKGSMGDGLRVSVTSNTVLSFPYKHAQVFDSHFAPGDRPYTPDNHPGSGTLVIDPTNISWMGPELDKGYKAIQWGSPLDASGNPIPIPLVSHDNWKNFFRTALTSTNGISISNANEDVSYRLSYSNMSHKGEIPNMDLFKNNISTSTTYNLTDNFSISADINYVRTHSNNRPAGNRGTNPITSLSYLSPTIDIRDLRDYWVEGKEGIEQRRISDDRDNPWFLVYEAINQFTRDHLFGNIKANWQITPHIDLMARYRLNKTEEHRKTKISKSYHNAPNGVFGLVQLRGYERNTDFLATYQNTFNDFDLRASIGGNLRYGKSTYFANSTSEIVIPGLFNLGNVLPSALNYSNSWSQRAMYSLYGVASIGYKRTIYLDVTGRNDWSSTLPVNNRSYFYPSASLSVLLDEAFDMSSFISLFKIRGGLAKAGKGTSPYRLTPTMTNVGSWGDNTRLAVSGTLLNPDLKPQIKTSYEFGTDLALMDNRIRLSATYYSSDNKNQILSVDLPTSTGFGSRLINAGLVRSKGVEVLLGFTPTPASSRLQWDLNFNFSRNRTTIVELTPEMKAQHKPFILWTEVKGGAWTYVGEEIGAMYDRRVARVEDKNSPYYGFPIIKSGGDPLNLGGDPQDAIKVGNFNPDFTMGLQTSVSFKGFTLSATIDWRKGGKFFSETYRYPESDNHATRWINAMTVDLPVSPDKYEAYLMNHKDLIRNNPLVIIGGPTKATGGLEHTEGGITLYDGSFTAGVQKVTDAQGNFVRWDPNLGGPTTHFEGFAHTYPWFLGRASLFDADFIKLRQVSLSYELPNTLVQALHITDADITVYSQNIILWTKAKIGIDPEHAFEPEGNGFMQGVEHYNAAPWMIPVGVKLAFTF